MVASNNPQDILTPLFTPTHAGEKWIWVVAGPNGAGKSFVREQLPEAFRALPYINHDVLAAKIHEEPQFQNADLGTLYLEAHTRNVATVKRMLQDNQSFSIETTIPANMLGHQFQALRQEGWKIGVIAVSPNAPDIAQARVQQRESQGGHGVPAFAETWDLCQTYLPKILRFSDRYIMYDNSGDTPILAATKDGAYAPPVIHAESERAFVQQMLNGMPSATPGIPKEPR